MVRKTLKRSPKNETTLVADALQSYVLFRQKNKLQHYLRTLDPKWYDDILKKFVSAEQDSAEGWIYQVNKELWTLRQPSHLLEVLQNQHALQVRNKHSYSEHMLVENVQVFDYSHPRYFKDNTSWDVTYDVLHDFTDAYVRSCTVKNSSSGKRKHFTRDEKFKVMERETFARNYPTFLMKGRGIQASSVPVDPEHASRNFAHFFHAFFQDDRGRHRDRKEQDKERIADICQMFMYAESPGITGLFRKHEYFSFFYPYVTIDGLDVMEPSAHGFAPNVQLEDSIHYFLRQCLGTEFGSDLYNTLFPDRVQHDFPRFRLFTEHKAVHVLVAQISCQGLVFGRCVIVCTIENKDVSKTLFDERDNFGNMTMHTKFLLLWEKTDEARRVLETWDAEGTTHGACDDTFFGLFIAPILSELH